MITKKTYFALAFLLPVFLVKAQWRQIENVIPERAGYPETFTEPRESDYMDVLTAMAENSWGGNYRGGSSPSFFNEKGGLYLGSSKTAFYGRASGYAYTSFKLADEITSAEMARISFDVQIITDDEFNRRPWSAYDVSRATLTGDSLPESVNTQFKFGLLNLETDEWYEAKISGGTDSVPYVFDFSDESWFDFIYDENGVMNVVFDLSAGMLAEIGEAGLALVFYTNFTEVAGAYTEVFTVDNFKVEYLAYIPEPSTAAAIFGFGVLLIAAGSRRKVKL